MMNLELGIAHACGPDGCRVRLLNGAGDDVACGYAAPVHNRIKIRPGDLVAVDLVAEAPRVVWRWRQARVLAVEDGAAVLTRNVTQRGQGDPRTTSFSVSLPAELAGAVQPGDAVIYGEDGVLARVADGVPVPDDAFRATFARIRAAYAA